MNFRAAAAWCCAGFVAAAATAQPSPAAPTPPRATVAAVVAGIVSYTRWPGQATALRLCTLGRGATVDELLRSVDIGSAQRPVAVHAITTASQARLDCQAVYVAGADTAVGRELLKSLAGQPVLLLGEGIDFCSEGGMFCLEPAATAVRFNANLDAIARSGLRVNPLVLRIARGAAGGGP